MDSSREITENCNHVRSISLPSKLHPLALKVEEGINKLKTLERLSTASMTTEAICNRLDGVRDLYGCVDDLLHLPLIQLGLINHPYAKLVNEASDGLVRLLDVWDGKGNLDVNEGTCARTSSLSSQKRSRTKHGKQD